MSPTRFLISVFNTKNIAWHKSCQYSYYLGIWDPNRIIRNGRVEHARKTATFFLRRFRFLKLIYIITSICLSIYIYDSLHNTVIKKNLCETQLRFEGQKSAFTCAQNFHLWTFLTRIKQVLISQPNYWYLGLFKNCKLKEHMHSVIVIKSQTIIKMMVFWKTVSFTLSK